MGTYIDGICQKKNENGEFEEVDDHNFFDFQNYGVYAWLADVRNYSEIEPITARRGLPEDYVASCIKSAGTEIDQWWSPVCWDDHLWDTYAHSWLMVDEILAADFDKIVEDRRVTDDSYVCSKGKGNILTLREYLGD